LKYISYIECIIKKVKSMDVGLFVYKGVLVLFDEKIGYFIWVDGCRVSNNDKQKILDYIEGLN